MKKVYLLTSAFLIFILVGAGCTSLSNKQQQRSNNQKKELPNNQQVGWMDMSNNILLTHLNETKSTTSTIFTDSSGNENHGSCPTESECPAAIDSGKINGAMNFDGNNDFINYGSDLEAQADYSITAWINLDPQEIDNNDSGTIISRTTSTNKDREYALWHDDNNKIEFQRNSGTSFDSVHSTKEITNTNTWHFIAVTYDDSTGTGTIYINGEKDNSGNIGGDMSSDKSRKTFIGKTIDGSKGDRWFFDGKIDEMALFKDRVLSPNEVNKIYNNQKNNFRK